MPSWVQTSVHNLNAAPMWLQRISIVANLSLWTAANGVKMRNEPWLCSPSKWTKWWPIPIQTWTANHFVMLKTRQKRFAARIYRCIIAAFTFDACLLWSKRTNIRCDHIHRCILAVHACPDPALKYCNCSICKLISHREKCLECEGNYVKK